LATLTSSPISGPLGVSALAGISSQTWNPSSSGTYVIKVTADSGSSIAESLEGNNVAQASFVIGAAPSGSIDLTVRKNGSGASYVDGPITVASGSTIDLQWTGTNVTAGTCVASGNWNGAKANPTSSQLAVSTPANPSTYTLTCNTTAGSKDDSVTVNILNAPVINATVSSSCIAPSSTDTALITWSQVANANSYEIYDNAALISTAAVCAAGTCSYNHSGLVAGSSHLYTVRSVNGSERVTSNSFLRTISNTCQPDLIPSMPTTASPLTVGSNITFNSTITNQGNYTTGAGFANSFGVYDSSGITLLATLTSSPVSGARYFFFCEEHQNGNRGYVIFDLKKEQWERVDKHISLLESMAGTHCRYINGTRIESTNPEYKYFSTQESWNKFCSIIQTENLDIHRPELELSQIIGFVTMKQLHGKE
jgi:hypothetical protein